MQVLSNLAGGFGVALTLPNLGFMLIGITLGILIGVLPGLGGANGIAILLPLTFSMNPTSAIIMLSCIYWGALFGGAITSILFNIPGEPWSVATTFDGYPMAQQGKAQKKSVAVDFSRKRTPAWMAGSVKAKEQTLTRRQQLAGLSVHENHHKLHQLSSHLKMKSPYSCAPLLFICFLL
jgi:TctA family transporter